MILPSRSSRSSCRAILFIFSGVIVVSTILALVGSKPGAADESTSPESSSEVGSSRSSTGGEYVSEVPQWFVPMFDFEICHPTDGYHCGNAVRLYWDYFLAPNKPVMEMMKRISEATSVTGGPGVFKFVAPLEIDISQRNDDDYQFYPKFSKTYGGEIGLYRGALRSGIWGGYKTLRHEHPLMQPPSLANVTVEGFPCKLLTYGHREYGADGTRNPIRKLMEVHVEKESCNSRTKKCIFVKAPYPGSVRFNNTGDLCGKDSDRGAPILCGPKGNTFINYIVSDVPVGDKRCIDKFIAWDLSSYTNTIVSDIRTFTNSRDVLFTIRPVPRVVG